MKFRAAQQEIALLKEEAAKGDRVLAFVDEAGFTQAGCNRSAWTKIGERHLIDATRGKRLNVIAALLSTGELFAAKIWETTTASLFVGFLGLLNEHVGKPITVIIDNASVHTAKAIKPHLELLKRNGLEIYNLPTYSPELNRIEKLWHKMKYEWLRLGARDSKTLEKDVDEIIAGFGIKYTLTFW